MPAASPTFAELEVGMIVRTGTRVVSDADLARFAAVACGGRVPASACDSSRMLVLACAVGLLPADPDNVLALRELREIRFGAAVEPGARLHVEARIDALTPLTDDTALVRSAVAAVTETGARAVTAEIEALWRRR